MDPWVVVRDLVLGIVTGILFFFFFRRVVRLSRWWAIGVAGFTAVALTSGFVLPAACRAYGLDRARWVVMGAASMITVVFYFSILAVLVCVMNLVWWAFTRDESVDPDTAKRALIDEDSPGSRSNRGWAVKVFTALALAIALLVTGYGYVRAQSPQITKVELSFTTLPSNFDGMTIALLTDLHISSMTRASFLPLVVDQVNDAHPDLVVIAGDLVDGTVANLSSRMSVLKDLQAPYGVVVTLGNHETYCGAEQWSDYFESLGLRVLTNDGVLLSRGSQTITVLGVADFKQDGPLAPDLNAAVNSTGSCEESFCVLAAHEPKQVLAEDRLASRLAIDLQLSGHTHAGQLWPLGYVTRLTQPAIDGVHVINRVTVVTSSGVGTFRPPERVGADPEIPLITLRSSG